jgi:hypothetical protein
VFRQFTQSADNGRLELVEAHKDGQPVQINLDDDQVLMRLQVKSSQGRQVHARDDGAKSLSKKMIHIDADFEDVIP